jgi:hypothetical protein
VYEPAGVINGIPVKDEAKLLARELPRPAILGLQVLGAPASDLPAEGLLRKKPCAEGILLPGGPDERVRKLLDLFSGQG